MQHLAVLLPVKMSFACQSWEVASGPTTGCEAEANGKHWICDGSDHRVHPGLSTLPLSLQSHTADTFLEDARFQHESSCCRRESTCLNFRKLADHESSVATQEHQGCTGPNPVRLAVSGSLCNDSSFWSPYHNSTLSVVSEDKPWDNFSTMKGSPEQDDNSSFSSLCSSGVSSPSTSEGVSGDAEAQSLYKGPLDSLCSLEEALPHKKGLSGFFSGKSRSFSCLADVAFVKDLSKPENPYTKKRKFFSACVGNANRSRFHPVRNGVSGISKKALPNSSKYTKALAVSLSAQEGALVEAEEQDRAFRASRWQSNSAPSRSYSLSDLQGAENHYPR